MRSRSLPLLAVGLIFSCAFAIWTGPGAAASCVLTAADFSSLKASKSGLSSQAQVDAYPAERQQVLCRTRAVWKSIANGTWKDHDIVSLSTFYLSPSELTAFRKVQEAFIEAKLSNMTDAQWRQFRQNLLDNLKK